KLSPQRQLCTARSLTEHLVSKRLPTSPMETCPASILLLRANFKPWRRKSISKTFRSRRLSQGWSGIGELRNEFERSPACGQASCMVQSTRRRREGCEAVSCARDDLRHPDRYNDDPAIFF